MKYKILLTGNNKTLIDDLFTKSSEYFEYQSTSARYEDIICHMKYFQPDGFLYCLNHEAPESFRRMTALKQAPEAARTSFFAIGTRAECNTYTRTAPDTVDLVLEKPITLSAMEEKIQIYFSSLDPSAAPVPIPVKQQQTVDNMVHALSQSQSANPAQAQVSQQIPGQKQAVAQTQVPVSPKPAEQAQAPVSPKPAVQAQAPVSPKPAAQASSSPQPAAQAPGSPKPAAQVQVSPGPAANSPAQPAAPVPDNKPAKPKQEPALSEADALLQALTNEIGESAKILETVEDMDLGEAVSDPPSGRKHILVVDDDSRMLKIIKRHLADKYDVATALNGRIAFKFLENKRTDLILLDYEMPLESGPDVLKKLRDNPTTQNIPVIFLTGISERDKIEKALALKPQGYLLKPIDHIKLLSTISKFVN